jgi:aerotaxis receptor
LLSRSSAAVIIAGEGNIAANKGLERMLEAEGTLNEITESVSNIAEMAIQMAAAVEEQAQVSDQINEQVENISVLAADSLVKGEQTTAGVQKIEMIAGELHELVIRFK